MPLAPLPSPASIVYSCAAQLQRAILSGELAPGERLPPERDLAAQLAVNRVTVRSALGRLAAAGLLDVRQGRGYTVRDFRRAGGPSLLPGLLDLAAASGEHPSLLADLLLLRRHLAGAVLERISAQRPPSPGLAAAIESFAREVEAGGGADAAAEADLAVLAALLELTGSVALQLCFNPVSALLSGLPALRAAMYASPAENLAGWRALLAWVQDPDPAGIPLILSVLRRRDAATLARLAP